MKFWNFMQMIGMISLVIFGMFGAMFLSIALHEYTHMYDYKYIEKSSEEIAVNLPTSLSNLSEFAIGTHIMWGDKQMKEEKERIESYTEFRAELVSLMVLLWFVICFLSINVVCEDGNN